MDTATWPALDPASPDVPADELAAEHVIVAEPASDATVERLNRELHTASAAAVVRRMLALADRPMLSSSFGPDSAALIRLVHDVRPGVPIVWVDTGHHTRATHRFVDSLTREWGLDLRIYRPLPAAEQASGAPLTDEPGAVSPIEVPAPGTPEHRQFAERVKLEPFRRALRELAPDVWLTGLRADETEHRRSLRTVARGPAGVLKVAPLRRWDEARTAGFLHARDLPNGHDYHDVVKGGARLECGLHDRL